MEGGKSPGTLMGILADEQGGDELRADGRGRLDRDGAQEWQAKQDCRKPMALWQI